jgi:hypothetical protein
MPVRRTHAARRRPNHDMPFRRAHGLAGKAIAGVRGRRPSTVIARSHSPCSIRLNGTVRCLQPGYIGPGVTNGQTPQTSPRRPLLLPRASHAGYETSKPYARRSSGTRACCRNHIRGHTARTGICNCASGARRREVSSCHRYTRTRGCAPVPPNSSYSNQTACRCLHCLRHSMGPQRSPSPPLHFGPRHAIRA